MSHRVLDVVGGANVCRKCELCGPDFDPRPLGTVLPPGTCASCLPSSPEGPTATSTHQSEELKIGKKAYRSPKVNILKH